ncbi:LutC/YkgG family protein [Sinimarinibacterium flocculans]|uniref:LutC/YkgG family protein n=1 Tax=Sinimarinibacterium flocculans TaxID=985250 RepID=UPI00249023E1|nr:lactate utilization protein C [Sinimarinibacterium flocculans]
MSALDDATRATSQQSRTTILQKLRAVRPQPSRAPEIAAHYAAIPVPDPRTRALRFAAQARAWQAEVVETDTSGWPTALDDVARRHGLRSVCAGRNTALATTLERTLSPGRLRWYDDDLEACKTAMFDDTDAGITTSLAGVAETGSLLLSPDSNEPRTLSLIPPLHIAVLRERDLRETLLDALQETGVQHALPTNLLLVTGPSKTADIQRMLVYGAHGPKALVILLIRDTQPGDGA